MLGGKEREREEGRKERREGRKEGEERKEVKEGRKTPNQRICSMNSFVKRRKKRNPNSTFDVLCVNA